MNLAKSMFLGSEGSYSIFEVPVEFENSKALLKHDKVKPYNKKYSRIKYGNVKHRNTRLFKTKDNSVKKRVQIEVTLEGVGPLSKAANLCIESDIFRCATQGYAHVLVHEMGHATASKLLAKDAGRIQVYTDTCQGIHTSSSYANLSDWKKTVIFAAGPMADITLSFFKWLAVNALKDHIPTPISAAVKLGAGLWITGELLYAYTSVINKDNGDFHQIDKLGKSYLAAATFALISQVALGILAVNTLF